MTVLVVQDPDGGPSIVISEPAESAPTVVVDAQEPGAALKVDLGRGPRGSSGIIISEEPPSDTSVLWLDIS